MNTSKIIVRLEAEERTAELEVMVPHDSREIDGLENTLSRLGMRASSKLQISTPRYRIARVKFAELDGSPLVATRVMQVLRAVRKGELAASEATRRAA